MRVNSKNLHLAYPDTKISLWGKNLHAPMAERVLELPMDVYDGKTKSKDFLYSNFCIFAYPSLSEDSRKKAGIASCNITKAKRILQMIAKIGRDSS